METRSKFYFKDNRPFSLKVKEFGLSLLFWKGRKKGMIHTRDIILSDIWAVFFPADFHQKYGYLGCIPWDEHGSYFKKIYPLVLAMDYEARPKWCPRWFLRFLHLFGNDNSIIRVSNRRLHNLHRKLTKGILFTDFKTKWAEYDLRISIYAPKHLQDLADAIEQYTYKEGRKLELTDRIKKYDPDFKYFGHSLHELSSILSDHEVVM